MIKWEYCRIEWLKGKEFTDSLPDDFHGKVRPSPNDDSQSVVEAGYLTRPSGEKEPVGDLMLKLSELGDEGWEMISHSWHFTQNRLEILYFKRQVSEAHS